MTTVYCISNRQENIISPLNKIGEHDILHQPNKRTLHHILNRKDITIYQTAKRSLDIKQKIYHYISNSQEKFGAHL